MAVETLKIVLTADNKQALLAMRETVTSLDGVTVASGKAGGATGKLGKDFTGMSRVIQDLPYGFNAISNNLTQLVPAAGAAGLAFSAIVTALTFAQIGFGAWTRGMADSKKATEEATKANEEFASGLAKEKTQLDLLFRTATNANIPLEARVQAVKTLRDTMGGYLKDFTDEEIMAGKAGKAYEALSVAIVKAARARAAQSMIEKKQTEALTLEEEILKKQAQLTADINGKLKSPLTSGGGQGSFAGQIVMSSAERITMAQAKFNDSVAESRKRIAELNVEMDNLGKTYDENITKPFKDPTSTTTGGAKGDTEESKEKKALAEMIKAREAYFAEIERMAADAEMKKDQRRMREMKGEFNTIMPEKSNAQQKDLTKLKLTLDGNTALNQIKQQQIAIDDQLNARTELATKLTDRAMQGLAGVANAMANGSNIGEAFGNMFKQLAIDIALAAAKAAIFQGLLLALPGLGGGGSKLLGGIGKLLGFSKGGTVSGPQSGYPVMLHGTEHIVRPDQMKSIIASAAQMGGGGASKVVVEGRIRGNDIFLSQQRTGTFRSLTT